MKTYHRRLVFVSLVLLAGCNTPATSSPAPDATAEKATVLISVTSDAAEQPQSVDMAMKLAGFSLEEGRQVAMFFNVKGVNIPVSEFPESVVFQDNSPIKAQIADLIGRGVDVHVCPICMKALGVDESDLIEGANVTTRDALFAHIGHHTTVFTY